MQLIKFNQYDKLQIAKPDTRRGSRADPSKACLRQAGIPLSREGCCGSFFTVTLQAACRPSICLRGFMVIAGRASMFTSSVAPLKVALSAEWGASSDPEHSLLCIAVCSSQAFPATVLPHPLSGPRRGVSRKTRRF